RLESTLKQDEILVDIVVENVDNLLAGHFVIAYDADRLEVGSVNATFCCKDQPGILDINVAGLGSLLQPGTITQIVFKKRGTDNGMSAAVIYLRTSDLRMYRNGAVVPIFSPLTKQLASPDLNGAYCYPNPFITGGIVTFSRLTQMARLRIYTIAGELVYDSELKECGGELTWNVKNDSGENVASGIYLYLITNPDGQTKTGKIGVVR
ncbi:MAG: T9SS type A sorting domain-containing protein, partial [bacterium]